MASEHELDELRALNDELKERLGGVNATLAELRPLRTETERLERENCESLLRLKAKVESALRIKPAA